MLPSPSLSQSDGVTSITTSTSIVTAAILITYLPISMSRPAAVAAGRTPGVLFAALIRTHHVTSRKKLQRVKKAAATHLGPLPSSSWYVLIRSGGAPGIMYAESRSEEAVAGWVAAVQGLRYKDFQCVRKPGCVRGGDGGGSGDGGGGNEQRVSACSKGVVAATVFEEVTSTTDFAARMEERGLLDWFKEGMGYT